MSDSSKRKMSKRKFCPYVKVEHNGKSLFLNKTTVVWLYQEGERVSSDGLFRVRSKQPFSSETPKHALHEEVKTAGNPVVCTTLEMGDVCIFKILPTEWKIGRVLQFSYYHEKRKVPSNIVEAKQA